MKILGFAISRRATVCVRVMCCWLLPKIVWERQIASKPAKYVCWLVQSYTRMQRLYPIKMLLAWTVRQRLLFMLATSRRRKWIQLLHKVCFQSWKKVSEVDWMMGKLMCDEFVVVQKVVHENYRSGKMNGKGRSWCWGNRKLSPDS